MPWIVRVVWCAALVLLAAGCSESRGEFVPGELLVQFRGDVTVAQAREAVEGELAVWKQLLNPGSLMYGLSGPLPLVGVPPGREHQWIERFEALPSVEYADVNSITRLVD